MSTRTRFGISPAAPVARNVGQTLNQVQGDTGGQAGFLFDWSLKSHVQPVWMPLSAFTMAEILLSLTIIGVVAAITLPSLTGNINERTWNTQRKALYARFSQAIALMPSLNGYGTLKEETDSAGSTSIEDTAAETFVTAGLSKVLKINNICDNMHLSDCGLPDKINPYSGSAIEFPTTMEEMNSVMVFNDAEDFEYGEDAKEIDSFDDIKKTKSKIKVSKNAPGFFKKHKYKLVTGALVVGGLIVGYLIGQGTNTPSQEPQSIVDTMDDENTTKTQEVEEKKLTAENFDQVVQDILTDNQSRGLNIDPTFIRSALFITNIDYLDQEDIKALYGGTDLNMIEEIQNMYNYTSAVGTHNNNLAFGNIDGSYISLANLAYDPEDKAVLHEMDVEFTDLVNDLNSKEMTSEEFQASFKYITVFYD